MSRPHSLPRLMMAALVAMAIAACADYKTPANDAVAKIDNELSGIRAQAGKYVPDGLAEVEAQVAELKAGIEQKEYQAVVATAPRVMKAVNKLVVDAALAKDAYNKKMLSDWATFATEMPKVIASVDSQIMRYTSRGGLPKGLSRDAFKETVATFDAAKSAWAEAAAAGNEGKVEEAVAKTNEVKPVIDGVMQTLGMSAG